MRCFIGIFPPDEVKDEIVKLQKLIASLPLHCKFVEKENLHISLSFLGNVHESLIEAISAKLKSISTNYKKFEVTCKKILFIPSKNYIRVIALDIRKGKEWLVQISKEIKKRIGGDVKPPHLTLCRVKRIDEKKVVIEKLSNIDFEVSFKVEKICLIQSTLTRSGPIYKILEEVELP